MQHHRCDLFREKSVSPATDKQAMDEEIPHREVTATGLLSGTDLVPVDNHVGLLSGFTWPGARCDSRVFPATYKVY